MNRIKRTLLFGLGAFSTALILSAPATAAENKEARNDGDRFVQVGGHRGHGPRGGSEHRLAPGDFGPGWGHFRGDRVHFRGHYRYGHGYWRGRHQWRGHRPYWHRYRHHPHYGHRRGYRYGHLGYGAGLVVHPL